jgi:uncharacterized RDD family membrane protein YckC
MVYGSVRRRIAAHILDMLVALIPMAVIVFIGAGHQQVEIVLTPLRGALLFLYLFYFHGKTGQTPGKKWLGLMVVSDQGQRIGFLQAARRDVIFLLLSMPWIVATVVALQQVPPDTYVRLWGKGLAAVEATFRPEWYEPMQLLLLVIAVLQIIVMRVSKRRKSVHDYIGGTVVIRIEPATPRHT